MKELFKIFTTNEDGEKFELSSYLIVSCLLMAIIVADVVIQMIVK